MAQGLPEQNPWQECILRVFGNYLEIPVPEPDSPHPHKFARPGTLSTALEAAGFDLVEEDSPTVPYPWPGTPEEYWESRRGQGALFPRLISRLAPERHDQVIHGVIESISEYYDGQQVSFTACMVVASGVR